MAWFFIVFPDDFTYYVERKWVTFKSKNEFVEVFFKASFCVIYFTGPIT